MCTDDGAISSVLLDEEVFSTGSSVRLWWIGGDFYVVGIRSVGEMLLSRLPFLEEAEHLFSSFACVCRIQQEAETQSFLPTAEEA